MIKMMCKKCKHYNKDEEGNELCIYLMEAIDYINTKKCNNFKQLKY